MFSVNSVCDEEDRVVQYGEDHQSISGLSSHDLENHNDLVTVQGHMIGETEGQDGALGQPDATNIQGSYVSLLADNATIDRTDEFTSRPLDTDLTDSIQYSVTNFSGKSSVQDLVGGGTLPTSLQTNPRGGTLPTSLQTDPRGGMLLTSLQTNPHGGTLPTSLQTDRHGGTLPTSLQTDPRGGTLPTSLQTDPLGQTLPTSLQTDPCGRTLPTSLQTDPHGRMLPTSDPLISYENQNLGYSLTSQPNHIPSQCLPQFVIFQNFGSSVISPSDGNNAFINMTNTVESPIIADNNKELEDAVANISDNTTLINPATDILPTDQSFLVSTNNQGEIQNIQIVPGSTLNDQNDSVKVRKKPKASKVVKKKKKQLESKPKERLTEVKKFSVDELTTDGEVKTKQQLYEEYIGMTEHDKVKQKPDHSKPLDDNFIETAEADDSNENVTDVIHVRIEKPPEQYEQKSQEQYGQKTQEMYEQPNELLKELNNETMDDMIPVDGIDKGQLPILGTVSVTLNTEESTKVSLETTTCKITDECFNDSANNAEENMVREIKIKVEGIEDGLQEDGTSESSSERLERSSEIRDEEKRSRKGKRQVKDDTRRQLKRKVLGSLKKVTSGKQRKKEFDACNHGNTDVEGRMMDDFCRIFRTEDKCILRLKPITLKLIKPNNQLVVEVHVEDNICISSISQSSSSDGLVKHCMHFEEFATDKVEKNVISNTRNVCTSTMIETKKKKLTNRKRKKSSKYTELNKRNTTKRVVIKEEQVPSDMTEARVPVLDQGDMTEARVPVLDQDNLKFANVTKIDVKDATSDLISNITSDITYDINNTDMDAADTNVSEECDDDSAVLESSTLRFDDSGGGESMQCDTGLVDSRAAKYWGNDSKQDKNRMAAKHKNDTNSFSEMSAEPPKDYKVHITDEGKKVYQCLVCKKEINVRHNMEMHVNQHTGRRPWQCEVCGLAFVGPSNLKTHMHQHEAEMRFSCEICKRKFRDRGSCQQHKKRHLGEKKHVCEHCGKSFVISSDLKKHIRTHTGEKPFKCKQCGLQFSDGSSYARHEKMHSGKYRYQCTVCSRQYTRRDGCAKHIKKSHKDSDRVDILCVSVEDYGIDEKLPDVTSDVTSAVIHPGIASTWSGYKSMNPTLQDQNQLSTSTTGTVRISPSKKSWQNFETLTQEASRRFKEQNDSIVTSNHSDITTKCDVTNVSHAIMLDSYQGAPLSQSCYGNMGQTFLDNPRQSSIPAYSLQTPTGQVYSTKLVNYQSVLKY